MYCDSVDWIDLAQDRDHWLAVVVRPLLSLKRKSHFKTREGLGKNKHLVMTNIYWGTQ
jgi:hypothetical protein